MAQSRFFAYTQHRPWNWNGWLGFHPFVLGFGLSSGASCQLQGGDLHRFCPRRHPVHAWNPSISPDARIRDTWNWSPNVQISWYVNNIKFMILYIYIYIINSSNYNANNKSMYEETKNAVNMHTSFIHHCYSIHNFLKTYVEEMIQSWSPSFLWKNHCL